MRRWYEPRNDKPDIPKNAPKQLPHVKVLTTLWREFWNLIKLNVIFLLSCIPIVTIPAAITAMSRITCTMVRDENFFLWNDYWKAFRRDFGRSLLAGIAVLLLIAIFSVSLMFYYNLAGAVDKLFILVAAFSVCLVIIVLVAAFYFFPMLSLVELPLKKLIVNSLVMVFGCFKRSLLAIVSFVIFFALGVGLLPTSALYLGVVGISLSSLMICFAVYPAIEDKVMVIREEKPAFENVPDVVPEAMETLSSAEIGGWDDEETENSEN
ncbi:MAG: DUF624 domain-containing protein [Clostridia bacterium]|nr:DUF624 domain-containing protein [Clostridia bacterium]